MDIFTLIINIIPSKVNSILLKRSNFAGSVSPIRGLLLLLFLFLISGLQGQLNIKIGYGGAYTKAQQTNNIISSYNQKMDGQLNQEVRAMHWLHGIDMGARYRRGNVAAEISWESLGNVIKATELNGNNAIEKQVYFRLNHLSFGSELIFDFLGMGSTLDLSTYKIETELNGSSENKTQAKERPLTSKFYLAFYVKGSEYLTFAIKPYYRVQWNKSLEMSGLSNYLGGTSEGKYEKFNHFGINICFYNGLQ